MNLPRLVLPVTAAMLIASCSSGGSDAPVTEPTTTSAAPTATPTPTPVNPYVDLSPNQRDRQLLKAARGGDANKVRLLLAAGADTEARDSRERTPLLIAATYDRVAVAWALVEAGADPDALDNRHDTAWLVTGVTGSVDMAKVILAANPDLKIRNRFGGISIIPASERGHDEYVEYVVGATDIAVNHVNDLGWTALLEAVILGKGTGPWQRIVSSLLAAGADPAIADRNGVTALQHARNSGFTQIADLLSAA